MGWDEPCGCDDSARALPGSSNGAWKGYFTTTLEDPFEEPPSVRWAGYFGSSAVQDACSHAHGALAKPSLGAGATRGCICCIASVDADFQSEGEFARQYVRAFFPMVGAPAPCVRAWADYAFTLILQRDEPDAFNYAEAYEREGCLIGDGAETPNRDSDRCRYLEAMWGLTQGSESSIRGVRSGANPLRIFSLLREARAWLLDDGWREASIESHGTTIIGAPIARAPIVIDEERVPVGGQWVNLRTLAGGVIRYRAREGELLGEVLQQPAVGLGPVHRGTRTIPVHIQRRLLFDGTKEWASGLYVPDSCRVILATGFLLKDDEHVLGTVVHEFFHAIFQVHVRFMLSAGAAWIEEAICEAVAARVLARRIESILTVDPGSSPEEAQQVQDLLNARLEEDSLFGGLGRNAWNTSRQVRDWSKSLSAGSGQPQTDDGGVPYQTGRLFYSIDEGRGPGTLGYLRRLLETLEPLQNDPHGYQMLDQALLRVAGRDLRGTYEDTVLRYVLAPEYRSAFGEVDVYFEEDQGLAFVGTYSAPLPLRKLLPHMSALRFVLHNRSREPRALSFDASMAIPAGDDGLFFQPVHLKVVAYGLGDMVLELDAIPEVFASQSIRIAPGRVVRVVVMNLRFDGEPQPWSLWVT